MQAYLKIENPGVAPTEAFTLLGASSKKGASRRCIGKFGSGNKHGVAVLLRAGLPPTVYAGPTRMEFGTKDVVVDDGIRKLTHKKLLVKYGGTSTATEDLNMTLDYGASDWIGVDLALREFVSNAIDRAIEQGEYDFNLRWQEENGITAENRNTEETKERFTAALIEYRKTARDYNNVTVEVVNENQVRASRHCTRVFVPMNEDVLKFYNALGKWFLHFSEPDMLDKCILPKTNRNLTNRKAAVIYRKGVRVREFESDEIPSLFDYNLDDLEMDEARKVDDWRVRYAAGRAVRDASKEDLAMLLASFLGGQKYWEHAFDHYGLDSSYDDTPTVLAARQTVWGEAFKAVAGEEGVISTPGEGELAKRKGYKVVNAPEAFVKFAGKQGIRTPEKVLTQDDREGREIIEATPDALAALDFVWDVVVKHGMTNNKQRPAVQVFRKIMEGGSQTLGFYRDNTIFLNADIAGYGAVDAGQSVLTQQLLVTALEEVAHHVTGATDNSRDFQDYVLNLAVKLAKVQAGIL